MKRTEKSIANSRQNSRANGKQDKSRANGRQSNQRTATDTRRSTARVQQSSQPVPKHARTDADVQQEQGEVITAQKQQDRKYRRS